MKKEAIALAGECGLSIRYYNPGDNLQIIITDETGEFHAVSNKMFYTHNWMSTYNWLQGYYSGAQHNGDKKDIPL
jgi:hypothetical protein